MILAAGGNNSLLGQLLLLAVGGAIGFASSWLIERSRRQHAERERHLEETFRRRDRAQSSIVTLRDELDRAKWDMSHSADFSSLARSIGDARRSLTRSRPNLIAAPAELKVIEAAVSFMEANEGYMFFASRVSAAQALNVREASAIHAGALQAINRWLTSLLDEERGELKDASDQLFDEIGRLQRWTNRVGDQLDAYGQAMKPPGAKTRRKPRSE